MAYDNKPGDVALFKFQPKDFREGVQYPSMTGYMVAHRDIREGDRVELAVWRREPKAGGTPFLSGQSSDPRPANGAGSSSSPASSRDEIPF